MVLGQLSYPLGFEMSHMHMEFTFLLIENEIKLITDKKHEESRVIRRPTMIDFKVGLNRVGSSIRPIKPLLSAPKNKAQ